MHLLIAAAQDPGWPAAFAVAAIPFAIAFTIVGVAFADAVESAGWPWNRKP